MNKLNPQSGFTLMEIVVATTIFAVVVVSVLGLFNTVLKINRQVQATRIASQTARNFTEVVSREIRNGRIDYSGSCAVSNQSLGMVSYTGEKVCFYLSGNRLFLSKISAGGSTQETINPPGMTINPDTFRFIVRPTSSCTPQGCPSGIQPMVTILAEFQVYKGTATQKIIPYQTTISTDVYDLAHKNP